MKKILLFLIAIVLSYPAAFGQEFTEDLLIWSNNDVYSSYGCVISPDKTMFAFAAYMGDLEIRDVNSKEILFQFDYGFPHGGDTKYYTIGFTHDNKYFIGFDHKNGFNIVIWNTNDWSEYWRIDSLNESLPFLESHRYYLEIANHSNIAAIYCTNKSMILDIENKSFHLLKNYIHSMRPPTHIDFSYDDKYVVFTTSDYDTQVPDGWKHAFFFDLEKYELLEECEGIFYEVVFTNDSYRFLVVEQGMIKIWNMETFKEISRTHVPDMGFFLNCDLFNTKDYLIYNNATVVDIYTGEEVCNYNQYNAGSETTSDMCISPDDEMIMFDNYGLYKTCWKHIGVEEQEAIEIINCYPNPAKTKLIVNLQIEIPENIIIAITDITGNIIREYDMGIAKVGINEYTLDISDLSAGAYFISASGSNVNLSQKIVIGG